VPLVTFIDVIEEYPKKEVISIGTSPFPSNAFALCIEIFGKTELYSLQD
jgi:hypothetical protein